MARRAERRESPNYTIIIVLGVVGVLAVVGGVMISSGKGSYRPPSLQEKKEKKRTAADLDRIKLPDPSYVSPDLPPHQRIYQLTWKARKQICVKDLQKALAMCEEALRIEPVYAGDVYFSMGICHRNYAGDNKLPYAEQIAHSKKSLEYYGRALAAYEKPGAKTTFSESVHTRPGRVKIVMKWEKSAQESWQRRVEAGILDPSMDRR